MEYTFSDWLIFFYLYCFLGWVWETCYVSVKKGQWVNRGFMHGPFLPIYGSGAIVVLIFTLPYRTNAVAVFFMGMISATILEYFTGVAMEKLFHVRYWDYTGKPLNLNGHICAGSSLAWGVFSVILTLYGHTPVERFVLGMNINALEFAAFALTSYISIDMALSVREAINLRELLEGLEQSSEEFRHLQKQVEVLYAFYGQNVKERSEAGLKKINSALGTVSKGAPAKAAIMEKLENRKKRREYAGIRSILRRNPYAVSKMHETAFSNFMTFSEQVSKTNK